MNLEGRISKLEKHAVGDKPEPAWLVLVYDETGKPNEAQLEQAKADYRREHPSWRGEFRVIWVTTEKGKDATEALIRGEIPWLND